uniref:(northern house mosquito) hypothetical protein n=1 Tax=Culex pipiens TaxID=7175 RepID=A0A8D8IUS5_CULPI
MFFVPHAIPRGHKTKEALCKPFRSKILNPLPENPVPRARHHYNPVHVPTATVVTAFCAEGGKILIARNHLFFFCWTFFFSFEIAKKKHTLLRSDPNLTEVAN